MVDLKDIVTSYITLVEPTLEQERVSKARLAICKECENRTRFGTCKICNCPLKAKSYSTKENPCPLGKWKVSKI